MNNLNVFNNPYYKWRYPSCWWKNIRMFFHSFKYAWQRITKGYADCDTFDLDSYYLDILSGTLNYLAENHYGYPGDSKFPTDEDWTAYLKKMAKCFYNANESNKAYPTPEEDKWWNWIETHGNKENNPYAESMFHEDLTIDKLRQKDFETGFDMLKESFWHLWD